MYKMMPIDVLQIIGNYSNAVDFVKMQQTYNLSTCTYVKDMHVIDENACHYSEIMDELVKQNRISDEKILEYALRFTIPKYITLYYENDVLRAKHKTYSKSTPLGNFGIFMNKNIVEYNYKHNGFRFNEEDLNTIFYSNCIDLMKIVQNYPQKSSVSVIGYDGYINRANADGVVATNELWQLNYKHKIVYWYNKYEKHTITSGIILGVIVGCTSFCASFCILKQTRCNQDVMYKFGAPIAAAISAPLLFAWCYLDDYVCRLKLPL